MKGLLRKDIYMLWSYCKSFLLLILIFSLVSLSDSNNSFYTIYPVMFAGILPVTIISYEERCKWNFYCQALPLSRKQVVIEKYLLSALCSLAILAVSAIVQYFNMKHGPEFVWSAYLDMMGTLLILALVGPSILLPLIFKLGTEKGRYAYFFVIGAACGLSILFMDKQFPAFQIPFILLPLIALAIYVLSCLLSIRFYQKREL